TVVFSNAGGGILNGTTDNGNGTYTAMLTSPTATGGATVSATLNGVAVGAPSSSVVTFTPGPVSAGNSTVSMSPSSVAADGSSTTTITVTAKDANNNVISGIAAANVVLTATGTGNTLVQPTAVT